MVGLRGCSRVHAMLWWNATITAEIESLLWTDGIGAFGSTQRVPAAVPSSRYGNSPSYVVAPIISCDPLTLLWFPLGVLKRHAHQSADTGCSRVI
jgi:hypothetical protein